MNSFFFVTVSQEYVAQAVNTNKLKRILLKRGLRAAITRLIVPINLRQTHWLCADVDLSGRTVTIYDSLGLNAEPGRALALVLGKYFQAEFRIEAGISPQQENGYDCGVFMLMNLSLLAVGQPLDFSQEDIPRLRKAMSLRVARSKWDLSSDL
jgi:sentrin-specific protease 1